MVVFKEGDKIRMKEDCINKMLLKGEEAKLTKLRNSDVLVTEFMNCCCQSHWVLVKPKNRNLPISNKSVVKRFKRCKEQFICPHCEYFGCYLSKKCVLELGHKKRHESVIKW